MGHLTKQTKTKTRNKYPKKKNERKINKEKPKITKNELFSYQSQFPFLVGVQNFPF